MNEQELLPSAAVPRRRVPLAGKLALVIVAIIAIAFGGYFLFTRPARIAYVSEGGPVPVTPPIGSSVPVPSPITCNQNITNFNASDYCGGTSFRTYSYSCGTTSGNYSTVQALGVCTDISQALANAQQSCRSSCAVPSPIPTPVPTPTSTPVATCTPRPACLDTIPRCLIPVTPDMCPAPSIMPTATPIPSLKPSPSPIPPNCYLKEVQCIQAPCPAQVVCPVPTAIPVPTVKPLPQGCYYQNVCAVGGSCSQTVVCPTPTPVPTRTPTPTPTPRPPILTIITRPISTYICNLRCGWRRNSPAYCSKTCK